METETRKGRWFSQVRLIPAVLFCLLGRGTSGGAASAQAGTPGRNSSPVLGGAGRGRGRRAGSREPGRRRSRPRPQKLCPTTLSGPSGRRGHWTFGPLSHPSLAKGPAAGGGAETCQNQSHVQTIQSHLPQELERDTRNRKRDLRGPGCSSNKAHCKISRRKTCRGTGCSAQAGLNWRHSGEEHGPGCT